MALDNNKSLEQIVSNAIIKQARIALDTSDIERQTLYYNAIRLADNEIKIRYHGEHSRRSKQMREINRLKKNRRHNAAILS